MPSKSPAQKNRDSLVAAMTPLAILPEFEKWIDTVRQMKDEAVAYMVNHVSVANERESLVSKGEVRAYLWIIQTYEGQRQQLEAQAIAEAEQRASQQH